MDHSGQYGLISLCGEDQANLSFSRAKTKAKFIMIVFYITPHFCFNCYVP